MIPYLITFFYIIGLTLLNIFLKPFKLKRILFCIFLFLPLIILCSFKSLDVGNDTSGYYSYYNYLRLNPIGSRLGEVEKGFIIFSGFFGHIGIPFSIFLFICYCITFFPIILFTNKYAKYPEIIALSIFLFQFFNFSISGLRQSLAIGICLLGLYILICNWKNVKKWQKVIKIVLYFLFVLLAYTFHRSSLIFIVAGFMFMTYASFKLNIWVFLSTCLLCAFVSPYIYGYIFNLIQSSYHYDPPSSKFFLSLGLSTYFLTIILIINHYSKQESFLIKYEKSVGYLTRIFYKRDKRQGVQRATFNTLENNNIYDDYFASILLANLLLTCLFNSAEVFTRTLMFFNFSVGFVLSSILSRIDDKTTRIFTYVILIIILCIYFYFASIRSGYLGIYPYKFGFYK